MHEDAVPRIERSPGHVLIPMSLADTTAALFAKPATFFGIEKQPAELLRQGRGIVRRNQAASAEVFQHLRESAVTR